MKFQSKSSRKRIFAFLAAAFLLTVVAPGLCSASEQTGLKPVQVFDIAAEKVVKTIENDEKFQSIAVSWLRSITGLAPQLNPDEKCGYVYRIPLAKPEIVKHDTLQLQIEDVFLFYCPEKPPILLVFDINRRPYLFQFKADLKPFLKKVGIPSQ